jgi:hypothetical protein
LKILSGKDTPVGGKLEPGYIYAQLTKNGRTNKQKAMVWAAKSNRKAKELKSA